MINSDNPSSKSDEVAKIIPELYNDSLKSAVQESGKAISLIPRAINAALSPLRQWIAQKEYNVAETEKLLAEKLKHISPDKISTPEAYIAIPTMQALSYSMTSAELRNLYANLLARAMNVDTKNSVHPSFIEIIKQLSPIDSVIFKIIMTSKFRPLITIQSKTPNGGVVTVQEYFSWITDYDPIQCCTSFSNLLRLGLIEIPHGEGYIDKKIYDTVKKSSYFQRLENTLKALPLIHIESYIKINNFSILFFDICVDD